MAGRIDLFGCPVDALTMDESLARIEQIIELGEPRQHMAVNANKVVEMERDGELREIVRGSAIINADGAAVVYASRFLGTPVPERVTGVDLFVALMELAAQKGYRPYLLGARPEVVQAVVEKYSALENAVQFAGFRDGYFPESEDEAVARQIAETGAHMLFVAIPTPRKEKFLGRYRDLMGVPFLMGVGGTFDVVSGKVARAPALFRNNGLEWLWRLIQEPGKMWRRNVYGSTTFVWRVLRARFFGYRLPEG